MSVKRQIPGRRGNCVKALRQERLGVLKKLNENHWGCCVVDAGVGGGQRVRSDSGRENILAQGNPKG